MLRLSNRGDETFLLCRWGCEGARRLLGPARSKWVLGGFGLPVRGEVAQRSIFLGICIGKFIKIRMKTGFI